jgi:hypothetical protein
MGYDYEDAAGDVRAVACMLNRMACCEGGGAWAHEDKLYALMGRVLLEAADVLEAAADKAPANGAQA